MSLSKLSSRQNDGGFAFQFKFPNNNGLSLHSVSLDRNDNAPMLTFKASNPFYAPSLTEQDVAVMAKLAMEGERPEFVFIAIPPGHPLHGRQYKQYLPSWIKGTSIGDLLFEVDWEMKCLSIGSKSNKEKTEFCSRHKTSKLSGLATETDFPFCKREGFIFMSCKSVTVEEADECLTFVGDPVMAITCDPTPAYGDYITAHYDSVAYYDEPLFLKMKELIKLILSMEWLVKKGIKFNQKWIHCHIKEEKPSRSQAVELYHGESLSGSDGKVPHPLFTQSSFGLDTSPTICDMLLNPKMPISLQSPDVETSSELYNETVPCPTVSVLEKDLTIRSSSGGISTSNIPVTSVTATTATAMKSRNQKPTSTEPYVIMDNKVSVKGSKSVRETTKPLRRRDKPTNAEYKVPPKDIAQRNGMAEAPKTFGASDSNELFNEIGDRLMEPQVKNVSKRCHLTASPTCNEPTLIHDTSSPAMDVDTPPASATQTTQCASSNPMPQQFNGNECRPESSSKLPPKESGVPTLQSDITGSPPKESGVPKSQSVSPHPTGDEPTLIHDDTSSPAMDVNTPPASTTHTTQCDDEASSNPMPQQYNGAADESELVPTLSSPPASLNISLMEYEASSKLFSPDSEDSGYSTASFSSSDTTNTN